MSINNSKCLKVNEFNATHAEDVFEEFTLLIMSKIEQYCTYLFYKKTAIYMVCKIVYLLKYSNGIFFTKQMSLAHQTQP